jgi:MFS family permease
MGTVPISIQKMGTVPVFFRKYGVFLRQPEVARLLWVSFLARLPIGMVGFAMLMFLREALGNFAYAGAIVGLHFAAIAVGGPIIGRIVDRRGPRQLLWITAFVQPLALLAVLAAGHFSMPLIVTASAALIAGGFSSPINSLTRALWRHRFNSEEERRTAFALDSVAIELDFTLGPAVLAIILASFGSAAAFGVAIAMVVFSAVVFLASPALKYFKADPGSERHLLGPLTVPRFWMLLLVTFGFAMSMGLLEVGYPAFATSYVTAAFAGLLLSLNSLGSAAGGMVYGGLQLRMPIERQFAATLGLMSIPLFIHGFIDTPWIFAVVAFFAGALIAPSIASQAVLVSRLAPAHYATEAFTWSMTFVLTGLGAGLSIGGYIVETHGVHTAFLLSGSIAAAMALAALLLFRDASSSRTPRASPAGP